MINIVSNYSIQLGTIALMPGKHIDYETIVLQEDNRTIAVKQSPFQLIQQACLENHATYEGKRDYVMHHTGFRRKVPIPIRPDLYMFPTHAVNHFDCCWIAQHHVHQIKKVDNKSCMIIFNDGQTITLQLSAYSIRSQRKRTKKCMEAGKPIIMEKELVINSHTNGICE